MFWFYSHPAVYIMILPVFGMISEILPVHARKPIIWLQGDRLFQSRHCFLGLIVWAHHMFTSGTPPWLRMFFMITTMVIAVPTGIKVFSWLATIWGGKLRLNSAMLFALGFLSMFVIGGISGVMVAAVPFDIHVHDTYFIVAHIHYVLFGGSVFGLYAGFYHWFPKMTGRMLNEPWGQVHFWLNLVGFNLAFLPMHKLGLEGMNRRIAEYEPRFAFLNLICTIGAYILAVSTIPFIVNVIWSWMYGPKAGDNPWKGLTLEWMTSSPPPVENFEADPVLATGPYDYGFGDRATPVDVPFSDSRDPALAAGPNSSLRATPDPAVAVSPDDRGDSNNH
jgi:cytochrome c oxidase subunit 1